MALRRIAGCCCLITGIAGLVAIGAAELGRGLRPPVAADEMLALGEERLRGGDLAGAAEWFSKAAEAEPGRLEPRLALGRVGELRGDAAGAAAAYEQALALSPGELEPALALARAQAADGRPQEAERSLEEARRRHPEALEPLVQLARLRVDRGDLDGAREAYAELEHEQPGDPGGPLGLAALAELAHDVAAARAAFERATRADPGSRAAWEGLGRLAADAGDLEAAERAYRRVTELSPADAGALTVLATIVERGERFPEATSLFRRALALLTGARGEAVQTRALAWTGLGTSLLAQGRRDEAYQALASALTDDPGQPEALWALVPVYLDRGQFEAARDSLAGIVGQRGDDPLYWVLVGRAEAGLGRWAEARRAFSRALALDEGDLEALRWSGIALRVLGDYRASSARLERFLEARPEDGEVRLDFAIALGQSGQLARARAEFGRVRQQLAGQPEPLFQEAHLLLASGQVQEARALAEQAVTLAPDDPGALEVLARVLGRQGERGRATQLAQRALGQARDDPQRRYLEGLVRSIGGGDLPGAPPQADPERGEGENHPP